MGAFFKQAEHQSWYNNTLFIFVSDHSSNYLKGYDFMDHKRFHIPLIFYGPALKKEYQGTHISTLGNHHDLATTLLEQLKIQPKQPYLYSKNLVGTSVKPFAYWVSEYVLGWQTLEGGVVTGFEKEVKTTTLKDSTSIKEHIKHGLLFKQATESTIYK
jgi:phosphoglycerol transferase MdoB-like AlkP superfamily enzyme